MAPERLRHIDEAARLLADAIARGEKMLIVADYDADGATACAVGVNALRAIGASVDYLVPNRFEHGYGLTPEIVRRGGEARARPAHHRGQRHRRVEGVDAAKRLGMRVLVTDHHLPGARCPTPRAS